MDWQLIVVYIIIAAAACITFLRLFQFFQAPPHHCSGCHQAAKGCSLEELRQQVALKKSENSKL